MSSVITAGVQTVLGARIKPVVISGGCRGGAQEARVPPLILGKKKKRIAEGEKADRASDKKPVPPLA